MSIHLLVVLDVLEVIFKKINSLLATFICGELNGQEKMKWHARSSLCKLVREGGLGLRDFGEVQTSLHMSIEAHVD